MDIGKKIKTLRTEKLMTQSELAGSEITRNMLSRIENGAALPSLGTVIYLAGRLGVPAGFLLSEGDEEFIYYKLSVMRNIRRAYTDKNFELCRDICLSSFENFDDELELILTDCCIGVGEDCIQNGHLHKACLMLDEAITHAKKTIFTTTTQENSIAVMFGLLKDISPALDSNEADTVISEDMLHPAIFANIFCKYITVILNIEKYDLFQDEMKSDKLKQNEIDKLFIRHLYARKQIHEGNYQNALETLHSVIDSPTVPPPRFLLYLACADMEICCREIEDYKGAYEFSQNKLEILEHMMAEE